MIDSKKVLDIASVYRNTLMESNRNWTEFSRWYAFVTERGKATVITTRINGESFGDMFLVQQGKGKFMSRSYGDIMTIDSLQAWFETVMQSNYAVSFIAKSDTKEISSIEIFNTKFKDNRKGMREGTIDLSAFASPWNFHWAMSKIKELFASKGSKNTQSALRKAEKALEAANDNEQLTLSLQNMLSSTIQSGADLNDENEVGRLVRRIEREYADAGESKSFDDLTNAAKDLSKSLEKESGRMEESVAATGAMAIFLTLAFLVMRFKPAIDTAVNLVKHNADVARTDRRLARNDSLSGGNIPWNRLR